MSSFDLCVCEWLNTASIPVEKKQALLNRMSIGIGNYRMLEIDPHQAASSGFAANPITTHYKSGGEWWAKRSPSKGSSRRENSTARSDHEEGRKNPSSSVTRAEKEVVAPPVVNKKRSDELSVPAAAARSAGATSELEGSKRKHSISSLPPPTLTPKSGRSLSNPNVLYASSVPSPPKPEATTATTATTTTATTTTATTAAGSVSSAGRARSSPRTSASRHRSGSGSLENVRIAFAPRPTTIDVDYSLQHRISKALKRLQEGDEGTGKREIEEDISRIIRSCRSPPRRGYFASSGAGSVSYPSPSPAGAEGSLEVSYGTMNNLSISRSLVAPREMCGVKGPQRLSVKIRDTVIEYPTAKPEDTPDPVARASGPTEEDEAGKLFPVDALYHDAESNCFSAANSHSTHPVPGSAPTPGIVIAGSGSGSVRTSKCPPPSFSTSSPPSVLPSWKPERPTKEGTGAANVRVSTTSTVPLSSLVTNAIDINAHGGSRSNSASLEAGLNPLSQPRVPVSETVITMNEPASESSENIRRRSITFYPEGSALMSDVFPEITGRHSSRRTNNKPAAERSEEIGKKLRVATKREPSGEKAEKPPAENTEKEAEKSKSFTGSPPDGVEGESALSHQDKRGSKSSSLSNDEKETIEPGRINGDAPRKGSWPF